ncbi:hypothetical protein [Paenirhodobacter ferrireducens]|uniref:hypothetical protein n=1 Tax=Paenirhodobacter ferrireducens TaxID=1215032 RepID=UPI0019D19E0C|nr:hypothetical protein [Sinirhodobacter ferrireducens]
MTLHDTWAEIPDTAALKARFRPVFDRIAAGALRRERKRELPFEEIGWLKQSGFTALRVPVDYGGAGGGDLRERPAGSDPAPLSRR